MNLNVPFNPELPIQLPPEEPSSKKMAGMKMFHPDLPQIPFFVGIVGPRHSGKSVLLYNLLSDQPGYYGSSFKKSNIIFYSKTAEKDPTMKHLKLTNVYSPPTPPEWVMSEVMSAQAKYDKADNRTGVLVVFDDATQLRDAWKVIEEFGYTGRHDHVHGLYVSHKMSSIPRGVRTQTQQWVLFPPHEQSEWQWVLEMFSSKLTRDLWRSVMSRAWTPDEKMVKPFIYIDYEESDKTRIYRRGFHWPLFTPEELAVVLGTVPLRDGKPFMNTEISLPESDQEPEEESDVDTEQSDTIRKKRKRKRMTKSFDPK